MRAMRTALGPQEQLLSLAYTEVLQGTSVADNGGVTCARVFVTYAGAHAIWPKAAALFFLPGTWREPFWNLSSINSANSVL